MDKVDIENWNRKEHFEFFSGFEDPSFGISTEVLCTKAYHLCKKTGDSFFAYYLHRSLQAVNETNEFKLLVSGKISFLQANRLISLRLHR